MHRATCFSSPPIRTTTGLAATPVGMAMGIGIRGGGERGSMSRPMVNVFITRSRDSDSDSDSDSRSLVEEVVAGP